MLSNNPSVAVIAHEVAHAIQMKNHKTGLKWHTKKHERIMGKILKIIENNGEEWVNKAKEKQVKKEETKIRQEQRKKKSKEVKKTPEYKLLKICERVVVWEAKKKKAENYLKKLKKQEKYYRERVKE